MIRKIWSLIASWFAKPKAPVKARVPRKKKEKSHHGAHYYLGDLLDRMEMAFEDMRVLRAACPDAYRLASRLGVNIVSSDYGFYNQIEPYFLRSLPSQVCAYVGYTGDESSDFVPCRFIVMQKHKRPVNVELRPGVVIYEVAMTYKFDGKACAGSFHVAINQNGDVAPLKECRPKYHRKSRLARMEWSYSEHLSDLASDNSMSIEQLAHNLVAHASSAQLASEQGLSVRVEKGKNRLAFSVDMLRTPYFFQDRQKVVNENGRTKPILHIVRAHRRKNGKVVKSHWRGLREFQWNGYNVKIGMGGKHLRNWSTFDAAAVDHRENEDLVSASEVADALMKIEDMA